MMQRVNIPVPQESDLILRFSLCRGLHVVFQSPDREKKQVRSLFPSYCLQLNPRQRDSFRVQQLKRFPFKDTPSLYLFPLLLTSGVRSLFGVLQKLGMRLEQQILCVGNDLIVSLLSERSLDPITKEQA